MKVEERLKELGIEAKTAEVVLPEADVVVLAIPDNAIGRVTNQLEPLFKRGYRREAGEAPLLRQATFSLWDDAQAMDAYARSGAHQQAIQGAHREGWFSESMFVRFAPLSIEGTWHGHSF